MTTKEYNKFLSDNIKDIDKKLKGYVYQRGGVLAAAKLRLYNRGVDGLGKSLGTYKKSTIALKKRGRGGHDRKTSNVTLKDTGRWYKSLFLKWEGSTLLLETRDPGKTQLLVEGEGKFFGGYGDGIMELSKEEEMLVDNIKEKFYQELVNKVNNANITEEI
jgi:hypothetical protein